MYIKRIYAADEQKLCVVLFFLISSSKTKTLYSAYYCCTMLDLLANENIFFPFLLGKMCCILINQLFFESFLLNKPFFQLNRMNCRKKITQSVCVDVYMRFI